MSEKFRLDRKICFQNTFYTKCINVIIDSIGPSFILRSIFDYFGTCRWAPRVHCDSILKECDYLDSCVLNM